MAVTKKPLLRYKILDALFRNSYKFYTIDLLLQAVNDKLFEIFDDNSHEIKLRQLQDDIAFMKSSEGWNIELADLFEGRKRIYRYENLNFSINNVPLNDIETNEIHAAIQTLSQFEGMPQFNGIQEIIAKLNLNLNATKEVKPFISFDHNLDLKGIEFFNPIYNAIKNKQVLIITYKDFKNIETYSFSFHPYFLKQYNNRWFVFGYNELVQKQDWNVAIDRIEKIEIANTSFLINNDINWNDYFSDMIGVTKHEHAALEEVILHFNALTGKYMENKPIHETQKNQWINEEILEIKLKIIINYELERLILSYADSVKVIQPKDLENRITIRLKNALIQY